MNHSHGSHAPAVIVTRCVRGEVVVILFFEDSKDHGLSTSRSPKSSGDDTAPRSRERRVKIAGWFEKGMLTLLDRPSARTSEDVHTHIHLDWREMNIIQPFSGNVNGTVRGDGCLSCALSFEPSLPVTSHPAPRVAPRPWEERRPTCRPPVLWCPSRFSIIILSSRSKLSFCASPWVSCLLFSRAGLIVIFTILLVCSGWCDLEGHVLCAHTGAPDSREKQTARGRQAAPPTVLAHGRRQACAAVPVDGCCESL